jgi:hypothetical protein
MFIVAAVLVAAATLSSCKKCRTCTAYYESDNTVYYEDHYCGRSVLVNTWEDSFKSAYDYGDTYVTCEND